MILFQIGNASHKSVQYFVNIKIGCSLLLIFRKNAFIVYTLYKAQILSLPVASNQSNNSIKSATVMLVTHFRMVLSPFVTFFVTIPVANSVLDKSNSSQFVYPNESSDRRFHNIQRIKTANQDFFFVLKRLLAKGSV